MSGQQSFQDERFRGLEALERTAFPRTCATCGRVYASAAEFLNETQAVSNGKSGLK